MATKNYKKKIAVVGYTGFIGSNLKRIYKSNFNFNSKKITKINKKLDLVLCAGTYSKRWIANKYPKKDLYNILNLTSFLKNIITELNPQFTLKYFINYLQYTKILNSIF